ncbi:facilitated trehalose transporter Tret1-like [Chironomus tepperi]|uniref:facilitated trehalose transporter Tret1-like n=1 Tax=Chironomus tepperi TaxID=113505 RepID=UPI00391F7C3D
MPLGAACSSASCGITRKYIGTKLTVFIYGIPIVIGYGLILFAVNAEMLMIGRFLIGTSAGCYIFIPVLYIGEIASTEIRGLLLSTFFFMVYCGVTFVFSLGHYASLTSLHVISASLPLLYSTVFVFLPESPPMLVSKNRIDEAKDVLVFLRGNTYNVEAEIDDLKIRHQATAERKSFSKVFSVKSTRKALFLTVCLFFFLQMSGITIIPFYSLMIFTEAGFSNLAEFLTIMIATMQALSSLFALATVDRYGRRILLIGSTAAMFVSLTGVATYFLLKELKFDVSKFMLAPFVLFCFYVVSFSIGLAPVTYVFLGEIFLQEAKVYVAPISKFMNFMFAFTVAITFPLLTGVIGFATTFYIYAFLNLLGTFFAIFFVPETKGASLAEIQSILGMDWRL